MRIDLNCDLGEGSGFDDELMPLLTSANIACDGHVSEALLEPALRLAKQHGVQVGAHPSFRDPDHFGRRELDVSPEQVFLDIQAQVTLLLERSGALGIDVSYLKPHGALYNMACRDDALTEPLVRLAEELRLGLMALPGSRLEMRAKGRCPFIAEGFADRRYQPDGSLVPRSRPDAFVEDTGEAVRQAEWLIRERGVQTLCVHGDNPQAVAFVRALRAALTEAGVTLAPFNVA